MEGQKPKLSVFGLFEVGRDKSKPAKGEDGLQVVQKKIPPNTLA